MNGNRLTIWQSTGGGLFDWMDGRTRKDKKLKIFLVAAAIQSLLLLLWSSMTVCFHDKNK